MDLERARYLVSDKGRAALLGLPGGLPVDDPVRLSTLLRRDFPPPEAAALAEQLTLRARATRNHRDPDEAGTPPLYTREGLEMMTHPVVSRWRAKRLLETGWPVLDLGCGLGGDLRAAVAGGMRGAGLERDAATALLARANVESADIARGDAAFPPFALAGRSVLLDPSRREGGTRRFDPAAFSPPWDVVLRLAHEAGTGIVKAPPGLGDAYVPGDAEVEAVQLGTSMREMTLYFGQTSAAGVRRAVLLPSAATLESTEPASDRVAPAHGGVLFDPESCVTRATLVQQLAWRLGAQLLDSHIAYLSSSAAAFSPLAATFEVLDEVPFSVARLRDRLRKGGWRPVDIRRRAFPVEPDEMRRLLGAFDGDPVTLLLTTLNGRRTVFIARRLFEPG